MVSTEQNIELKQKWFELLTKCINDAKNFQNGRGSNQISQASLKIPKDLRKELKQTLKEKGRKRAETKEYAEFLREKNDQFEVGQMFDGHTREHAKNEGFITYSMNNAQHGTLEDLSDDELEFFKIKNSTNSRNTTKPKQSPYFAPKIMQQPGGSKDDHFVSKKKVNKKNRKRSSLPNIDVPPPPPLPTNQSPNPSNFNIRQMQQQSMSMRQINQPSIPQNALNQMQQQSLSMRGLNNSQNKNKIIPTKEKKLPSDPTYSNQNIPGPPPPKQQNASHSMLHQMQQQSASMRAVNNSQNKVIPKKEKKKLPQLKEKKLPQLKEKKLPQIPKNTVIESKSSEADIKIARIDSNENNQDQPKKDNDDPPKKPNDIFAEIRSGKTMLKKVEKKKNDDEKKEDKKPVPMKPKVPKKPFSGNHWNTFIERHNGMEPKNEWMLHKWIKQEEDVPLIAFKKAREMYRKNKGKGKV